MHYFAYSLTLYLHKVDMTLADPMNKRGHSSWRSLAVITSLRTRLLGCHCFCRYADHMAMIYGHGTNHCYHDDYDYSTIKNDVKE